MKNKTKIEFDIHNIFPTPIYSAKRDSNLDSTEEEKEIENIIAQGMQLDGSLDQHTNNTYIFNTNLKNLKEFCEQHINIYVKKIISPQNKDLEFYITQSWINVVKPGGEINQHWHENSIISGVFYLTVEEGDKIMFNHDPYWRFKAYSSMGIKNKDFNLWNSPNIFFLVNNNQLLLFPSWLPHSVEKNENATTDRISISFNTFVRGTLGDRKGLTELILL